MTVVSVHIADVGLPKSLGLIRHPRPASIPGLLQANAGLAAEFGTTPARPSPGRGGLIAFGQDEDAPAVRSDASARGQARRWAHGERPAVAHPRRMARHR